MERMALESGLALVPVGQSLKTFCCKTTEISDAEIVIRF